MNFSDAFLQNRKLVLVDFYADWCEPCKWAEPVIEQVLQNFNGEIVLQKINIDEYPEVAKEFHILSVPTFLLFKNGNEIWRKRGFDIAPKMLAEIINVMV